MTQTAPPEPDSEPETEDVLIDEEPDENLDEGEPSLVPASTTKAIEMKTTVLKRIDRRKMAQRIFREMDGEET
jgi:hypothetical protein